MENRKTNWFFFLQNCFIEKAAAVLFEIAVKNNDEAWRFLYLTDFNEKYVWIKMFNLFLTSSPSVQFQSRSTFNWILNRRCLQFIRVCVVQNR